MKWGIFDTPFDDPGSVPWQHVAPCTEDGELIPPHTLSASCCCNPTVYQEEPLILHEVIQ